MSAKPSECVLFSFDDQNIELTKNLKLTMVQAEKYPGNPIMGPGPKGSVDATHTFIYGSVIFIDGKFRMWYLAMFEDHIDPATGNAPGMYRPMCYAESTDGIHWTKPDLGLCEFNGNKHNNICRISPEESQMSKVNDFLCVLHDPDDPDPKRRYKTIFIAYVKESDYPGFYRKYAPASWNDGMRICATTAVSADGLKWTIVGDKPVIPEHFEVSMLYKFGNFYYAGAQQNDPWIWAPNGEYVERVLPLFRSSDFESWSEGRSLGFARMGQLTHPKIPGQQTHMGAGIWNRGNVLLGIYGMWQDGMREKRPAGTPWLWKTRVDLGFIVSNDGLHFREPVPDHAVIKRGEEGKDWDTICLLQAHAFANVGDRTYMWYSHWNCDYDKVPDVKTQAIGLATLRRDGFGYLGKKYSVLDAEFVTKLLEPIDGQGKLFLNIDSVSEDNPLRVELIDEFDKPISNYAGKNAAVVTKSGLRVPIEFPKAKKSGIVINQPFALRVLIPAAGEARFYAAYKE